MLLVVVNIFLFSCFIQSTFALKCFNCDSTQNPKCIDLSDRSLQPQECVVDVNRGYTDGHSPVCVKITAYNNNVVTRSCYSAKSQLDAENACKFQLEWGGSKNPTEFCGHCSNEDGCNNANSLKFAFALVIFGTVLGCVRLNN